MLDKMKCKYIIYVTLYPSPVRVHLFCRESYLSLVKITLAKNNGTGGSGNEAVGQDISVETWPVENRF
jgi:hypothetical protein